MTVNQTIEILKLSPFWDNLPLHDKIVEVRHIRQEFDNVRLSGQKEV